MPIDLNDAATGDLFACDVLNVPDVPATGPKPAPIQGGTPEQNERASNGSLKNEPRTEGTPAAVTSTCLFGDVLDVPDVEASTGAGFHGTARETADVPGVPALGDLLARASGADGSEHPQAAIPAVPDDERPCFRVYDAGALLDTGRKLRPGVWHHGMSTPRGGGDPAPVDTWVCGPLHIEAQTFDGTGNNFGRLLRFKNTAGRWRTWAMPRSSRARWCSSCMTPTASRRT